MASYSKFIVQNQRTPSSSSCQINMIRFKVQRLSKNHLDIKNAFNLLKLKVK